MAHTENKPRQIETTVCLTVQFIYRGCGGFASGRFRHMKLLLQACQRVKVNKLYLSKTPCCVPPLLFLRFRNTEHEAQHVENKTLFSFFLFEDRKAVCKQERRAILKRLLSSCYAELIIMLCCSDK